MSNVSELRTVLIAMGHWVVIHRWDFVYRVAVTLLLLAWLRVFPVYLLTIYTGAHGIPPFELAGEDFAGVRILLTWTLVLLVLGALYFWSPLILFILRRFYLKDPIKDSTWDRPPSRLALFLASTMPSFWCLLPTVVISAALAIAFGAGRTPWALVLQFWLASLLLALSVFLFVRRDVASAIVNWQGPLAFVLLSIALPVAFKAAVTDVLDATLRQYRVGGMLPVVMRPLGAAENGADPVEGKLLLLGKHSIYVDQGEGNRRTLVVIANGENLRVEIGRPRPPEHD